MEKTYGEIAGLLGKARRVLFITGAGVSADSGLPTYRGIGGLYNRDRTDEGISIEQALSESRATLDRALSQARAVAAAERAGIEAARAVVEAVTRIEESAAAVEAGQAEAAERAIDDEVRATGRVTEAARRSWERWQRGRP